MFAGSLAPRSIAGQLSLAHLLCFLSLQLSSSFEQSLQMLWWDRWTSAFIKEGSEMERVAPGGRKETEKQDGNLRFPDLNVTAYYCHCRSAFISEPLGRFSSTGALMLQRGLSQTLKQAKISGLKTKHPHKKASLAHRACSCRFSTCLAPPAAWGLSTTVSAQQPLPGCCPVSAWAGSYRDHHQQPSGKVTGTEPQAVCSPSSLLPALGVGKGCCN